MCDPVAHPGLHCEARHPLRVGRHTGDRCDLRAEFPGPKYRAAAEAAADIKDLAAKLFRRVPHLGRAPQHKLLTIDERAAAESDRRALQRRIVYEAGVIVDAWTGT